MSDLFLDILNRSIAASWVVLAVILARFLLRRAPRSYTCYLWWIVGARLYYSNLPKAPFSLIPSTETITPESLFDRAPEITSGVPIIDNVVNPVYTESFRADPVASVNPLQVWTAVAANIWLIVMVAIWIWAIISWLRVRRRVRASVNLRDNIYICDDIDTPFILGSFSPKIYLPSALTEEQQRHVIAHEEAHIIRRDFWYKPWAYFLLSVHWFNPAMWVAYTLLCRDIELACDEHVIGKMTAEEIKGYSTALLDCSIHRHMIAACPLAFGEVGVKERVKAVLHYKKPAFWIVTIATLVLVFMIACFTTDPLEQHCELRWNDTLYERVSGDVSYLPNGEESIGSLRSILHDTTEHPMEELQATNLDESLAGCPLYQEDDRIYLQKMDGECILFRAKDPGDVVQDYAYSIRPFRWWVYNGNSTEFEEIRDDLQRSAVCAELIKSLKDTEFTPGTASGNVLLRLTADNSGSESTGISLRLYDSGQWELTVHTKGFANSRYTFASQTLDAWAAPLIARSSNFASVFDEPTQVRMHTVEEDTARLRFGLPEGWEFELMRDNDPYDDIIGVRFRPADTSGEIELRFYPEGAQIGLTGGIPVGEQREFSLANGLTGTRITPNGSAMWGMMVFNTQSGTLFAGAENAAPWWPEYGKVAEAILASTIVEVNGSSILTEPNYLGIHLSVENPTPSGLMLITTQDGTPWNTILTGSNYSISKWDGDQWVALSQAANTAWTLEAYGVPLNETIRTGINWQWVYGELEPGLYRIYKSYSGERGFLADRESVDQSFYAEFIIE